MRGKVDERSPETLSRISNPLVLQFMLRRNSAHKHRFEEPVPGSPFLFPHRIDSLPFFGVFLSLLAFLGLSYFSYFVVLPNFPFYSFL